MPLTPPPAVVSPKSLIVTALVFLALAFIFGFLNQTRLSELRSELASSTTAREIAVRAETAGEKRLKARETEFSAATSKAAAEETKANSVQAQLTMAQNDKAELEGKLQAKENQIADLQKRIAEATVTGSTAAEADSPNDLKAQLEDARHQLEAASVEKSILADRVKEAQDRIAAMEEEKKRRQTGANAPGLHGTVLAVNQAYNFVVLSLGDRQGVVPNSEMLVLRHGTFIGKIRISSVEPTTSIGDIIVNSLARGVQVQPGDTVIYAGSTHS